MNFCNELLKSAYKKNNIKSILEHLRNSDCIVIWGTGLAGKMIKKALDNLGIEIACFVDGKEETCGQTFQGAPVRDIKMIPEKAIVIIAANVHYGIHQKLACQGHSNYYYIDPIWLFFYDEDEPDSVKNIIEDNYKQINQAFNMLADDYSRKVFSNILSHRIFHDLNLIWEIYDPHQYFGNDLIHNVSGNFADCGAFQGDTLRDFMGQIGNSPYHYFAFEADEYNYNVLKKACCKNQWENTTLFHIALWKKRGSLFFVSEDATGEVSGKIADNTLSKSVTVDADSLDNILENESIDFIKMDIEGAEMEALEGGVKIIKEQKPTLAISAYHKLSHLWEIPLYVKRIVPEYQIYFRHHMWNMADTVCYGICDKERSF